MSEEVPEGLDASSATDADAAVSAAPAAVGPVPSTPVPIAAGMMPAVMPELLDEVQPKRQLRWRRYAIIASILVVALAAAAIWGFHYVRRPMPRGGENLPIAGLLAPVRVTRDDLGVPRIYADHTEDLFRAQGYLDASERFFQMDYRRHVATGRLAELIGGSPEAVASDQVVRTIGWPAVAEQEWELLDQNTRAILEAYAAGVNAYLLTRTPEQISLEYSALERDLGQPIQIAPWHPTDSLAWLKVVAWEMRSNFDEELDRTLAFSSLQSVRDVNRLFPEYALSGNAPILNDADVINLPSPQLAITGGMDRMLDDFTPFASWLSSDQALNALAATQAAVNVTPRLFAIGGASGSNSWVVAGRYTESGAPMVANDPHLALTTPSVFSQVGLFCNVVSADCPFEVAGFSLAGFPGVYVGHNGQLAWGLTNLRADNSDLYVERLSGDDSLVDNAWLPMQVSQEIINLAGGEPPVPITVRNVFGRPLLSDIYDLSVVGTSPYFAEQVGDFGVSLAWAGLVPGETAAGLLALNTATNADDVAAAAAKITAPTLGIVFGTTSGDIGFQAAGLIPVRSEVPGMVTGATTIADAEEIPTDGTWPQDGRLSSTAWQGWVPAEQMPRALNPESGIIVAANQAVTNAGVGPHLGADFDYGFRAARITSLLNEVIARGDKLTAADMASIQFDTLSPAAAKIVPVFRGIHLESDWVATGQRLLDDWDYRMTADSAAAAYFASAWNHVLQLTFWDELPDPARPDGTSRWLVVLGQMLNNPHDSFWDDRSTLDVTESRDEVLRQAMQDARNELTTRVSSNTDDWHWGALHQLRLVNPVTGTPAQSWLSRWIANPPAVSTAGSTLSVNATAWPARVGGMGVMTGPAFRVIMDTGNWDGSTWVNVPGNSGHPMSRYFTDQLMSWNRGEQFAFGFRDAVGQSNFATFVPN